jgi:hypothetical protein
MLILRYDPQKFAFRQAIERYFSPSSLEHLHLSRVSLQRSTNDQGSPAHITVYQQLDQKFFDLYRQFVVDLKKALEPGDWLYQKVPTFRFQYPHETGTKEFHRDRDYNHVPQTVNVVVPLTKMLKSTAIQVETAPFVRRMMESMDMDVGEFCIFDGANRKHGTLENREGYTRVSFDFRLLQRQFLPIGVETVNKKVPFSEYYVNLESI